MAISRAALEQKKLLLYVFMPVRIDPQKAT